MEPETEKPVRVTVRFNVGMTFASLGYTALLFPINAEEDSSPLILESFFQDSPFLTFCALIVLLVLAVAAWMFIARALWNRLFPRLCGWNEITLAESYALSLLIAIFVMY